MERNENRMGGATITALHAGVEKTFIKILSNQNRICR